MNIRDRREREQVREVLFAQQNGRCLYCCIRIPIEETHLDHIIPRAKGGLDESWNLAITCPACNMVKRDKPAIDLVIRLLMNTPVWGRHERRRKISSIHISIPPSLIPVLNRYAKEHPEVSISRLCSGFIGQYLYDRGYRPDGKETSR